jgi:hypothetical protein
VPGVAVMRMPEGVDLDLGAVGRGALLGLAVVAPASLADLALSSVKDLDEGWLVFTLFAVILGAFFLAGYKAATTAEGSPYTHGAVAGLAAFALWLPLRVATRALVGEQLLGREGDAAFKIVEAVVTAGLFAMSFGILGGFVGAVRNRRR